MHTMASWYSHYGRHGYMVAIAMGLTMTTSGHLVSIDGKKAGRHVPLHLRLALDR